MASQLQQDDRAVASFTRALSIDPFLVSAEFGLARAYQRMGNADAAHTHLERFQRLTTEKVAAAMSLSYGDQGPLSLAEPLIPAGGKTAPAIPVTFAAAPSPFPRVATTTGSGRDWSRRVLLRRRRRWTRGLSRPVAARGSAS